MTFEITDENYYLGMWYHEYPPGMLTFHEGKLYKGGNTTFLAYQEPADIGTNRWQVVYRHRYYANGKLWTGEDQMTWRSATLTSKWGDEDELYNRLTSAIDSLAKTMGGSTDNLPLRCKGDTVLSSIEKGNKAWLHIGTMPADPDRDGNLPPNYYNDTRTHDQPAKRHKRKVN